MGFGLLALALCIYVFSVANIHSKFQIPLASFMSAKSSLFTALIFILSGILLPEWRLIAAVPIAIIALEFMDRGVLRYLGSGKFLMVLAGGSLLLPLLGGGGKISIAGVGYSLDMMILGLRIVSRGFLIFTGMSIIRRHIPPDNIANALWRIGLRKLSVLIPLSLHLVPALMESSLRTIVVWRGRGGLRKRYLRNLMILFTSIQIQWIKEAEDLTIALALAKKERSNDDCNQLLESM